MRSAVPSTISAFVPADSAIDIDSNQGNTVSNTKTIVDGIAPIPRIEAADAYSGDAAIPVKIVFDEDVTGFPDDLVEVNGGRFTWVSIGSNEADGEIAPDGGNISISVVAGKTTDLAGNPNGAATAQISYGVRPAVVLSIEDPD